MKLRMWLPGSMYFRDPDRIVPGEWVLCPNCSGLGMILRAESYELNECSACHGAGYRQITVREVLEYIYGLGVDLSRIVDVDSIEDIHGFT